jgi:ribosomal-protein-alanine N-acetyltransferase
VSGESALITTPRLDLVSLRPEEFPLGANEGLSARVWESRDLANPYRHLVDEPGPLPHRIAKVQADPTGTPWYLRLAVLRQEGVIIGSGGFHDRPDAAGAVEIGLEVEPPFRRQGFAREILHGMWGWAAQQPGVRTLRYSVGVANLPSQRLIRSFGFEHVGVQVDDDDGPEDVFELSATQYRASMAN